MQLSVMLNNFGVLFHKALDLTQQLEIPAVQLTLVPSDTPEKYLGYAEEIKKRGLKMSAISVDVGDLGEPEEAAKRVEAAKPWMDAAAQIGEGICQTHVGIMPHNTQGPRWDSFVSSLSELAQFGEKAGACLALETGPEPARVIETLMQTVNSAALKVNYDPANLYIWPALLHKFPDLLEHTNVPLVPYEQKSAEQLWEPVEGVARLAPYIVHVHAKDGAGDGGWADVPLGTGLVDWPRFLRLLRAGGYDGYLAIEREGGDDRFGEIKLAAEFLRERLAELDAEPKAGA